VCGVEKCVKCNEHDECEECISEYGKIEEDGHTKCVPEEEVHRFEEEARRSEEEADRCEQDNGLSCHMLRSFVDKELEHLTEELRKEQKHEEDEKEEIDKLCEFVCRLSSCYKS